MKNYLENNSMQHVGRTERDSGDHETAAKYIARGEKDKPLNIYKYVTFLLWYTQEWTF